MNLTFNRIFSRPTAHEILNFNIFRSIFCFYLVFPVLNMNQPLGIFRPITLVEISGIVVQSPEQFFLLKWLLIFCLFLTAIGYRARLFLGLSAFLFLVHFANAYSFLYDPVIKYMPQEANICFLTLLILFLSPFSSEYKARQFIGLSETEPSSPKFFWPKHLIIFSLGWIYFSAFIAKITRGNWSPLNGDLLQMYLREFGLFRGNAAPMWLASQPELCHLGAVFTLIFEATALFAFFIRPARNVFIALALVFHVLIFIFFGIDFLTKIFPVFFIFVDWPRLFSWAARYFKKD